MRSSLHPHRDLDMDAAAFDETMSKLPMFLGTQLWHYATIAVLALVEMEAPVEVKLMGRSIG